MKFPDWWVFFSGLFFALGSLVMVGLAFVSLQMIAALKELTRTVRELQTRVDLLSNRVGELLNEAQGVTRKVGGQASGLLTDVNSIVSGSRSRLEWVSTFLLLISMVRNFLGLRRKGSSD